MSNIKGKDIRNGSITPEKLSQEYTTFENLPKEIQFPADSSQVIRTETDVQINSKKADLVGHEYVETDEFIVVPSADPTHAGAYPSNHYVKVQNIPTNTNYALSLKADLVDGIVPSSQLPTDRVPIRGTAQNPQITVDPESGFTLVSCEQFLDENNNPVTPTEEDEYFGIVTKLIFRYTSNDGKFWASGGQSLQIGSTQSTAFRGDLGQLAYNHSQIFTGNPHNTTKTDIGLSNVDNTSDANKPVSNATQTAISNLSISLQSSFTSSLNLKENVITPGTSLQYLRGDKTWQTLPTYNIPVKSTQAQTLAGTDDSTFITPLQLRNVLTQLSSPIPNWSSTTQVSAGTQYTALSDGIVVLTSAGISIIATYTYTINGVTRNWGSGVLAASTSSFSFTVKQGDTYSCTGVGGIFVPLRKFYN